jgi:PAS domain S-box-containing protein
MSDSNLNFLSKGGEMAELIRNNDCDSSALGPISEWPVILRTTIGIILGSNLPTFLVWGKELIFFYNDASLHAFGHNGLNSFLIGRPMGKSWPQEWNFMKPFISQAMKSGNASLQKEQMLPLFLDDKLVRTYWSFNYIPIQGESGNPAGVIINGYDETDKADAYRKAQNAEERTRLAIEIAEISSWELDLQTHQMIHSETLATTFGHNKSTKLSYADMLNQIEPDDLANIVDKAFEQATRTGQYKYEIRIIKRIGEIAWIKCHGRIFLEENGEPQKMIGTIIDVTAERQRRLVLMESEYKFRLLADSMSQLIWTADLTGNLSYYNLSVFKFTGLTEKQLNEGGFMHILHPDDRAAIQEAWVTGFETGNSILLEHRLRNASGEYIWHVSRATAQLDVNGNVQMWVGTSTDIQEQKSFTNELEKQVRERTEELVNNNSALVKMNIELQSFAYVSSHDLQEPLRKIQLFISRLYDVEQETFSEITKEYFGKINMAAIKMQTLIRDLLAYSRTNNSERIFIDTNLSALAKEVISEYKDIIDGMGAVVETKELCNVKVIPFQFRQLFSNLIGNALKFSAPGVVPHITVEQSEAKEYEIKEDSQNPEKLYCHIRVTDNGIGFDAQYNKRIFEVFQRLHTNSQFIGTGIGLAIVQKIVDNHQGFIKATGIVDQGAQFDIYIPIL